MGERQGRVSAERIITEIPHTRTPGRQYHDDILTAIAARTVAQVIDVLAPFITENPNQSWTSALEKAEKKVLRNLQAIEREGE